jgi:hypothetical protein
VLANAHVSAFALIVFILRPVFHPVVDVVNWQRLAAFEKERGWRHFWEDQWTYAFRAFCATYAVEVPLVVLLLGLFGTIAGLNLVTSERADIVQAFISQLVAQDNFVAMTVVSLFLFSLFAMAVATMSSLFAASLCTIDYDIVPMLRPESILEPARALRRTTIVTGVAIGLLVFAIFYLADKRYEITLTSTGFLALVVGFTCLQLSFAPLVLGPLVGRSSKRGTVDPKWAVVIMLVGALIGSGTVATYLATEYDPWLWAAAPGCLGSSTLLFLAACLWRRQTAAA